VTRVTHLDLPQHLDSALSAARSHTGAADCGEYREAAGVGAEAIKAASRPFNPFAALFVQATL
jgi:hypothetical protein